MYGRASRLVHLGRASPGLDRPRDRPDWTPELGLASGALSLPRLGSGILRPVARPRTITELGEALLHAPRLDRAAREQARDFLAESLPPGLCHDWLGRHFAEPETVLVVLEDAPGEAPAGFCLTGPFVDPLWPERLPMVLLLHVEPTRRHQGLASALVAEATRELGRRGLARVAARAGTNDDALISMGERWGFVRQWELMLRE